MDKGEYEKCIYSVKVQGICVSKVITKQTQTTFVNCYKRKPQV